jgi:DNA-binding NtrC family response regulator
VASKTRKILVVEDEAQIRAIQARYLRRAGHEVIEADSCAQAFALIEQHAIDLALIDVHLPDGRGFEVVDRLKSGNRSTYAVVMTADGSIDHAIAALHKRADDFLLKPFSFEALEAALERATPEAKPSLKPTGVSASLMPAHEWRGTFAKELLGQSKEWLRVFDVLRQVSDTDCSVLITGESGTGKELVARALHNASARAKKPFVPVNCAAIPENLVESELFGHLRGAFTGAIAPRQGRFAEADGGTLFLDEIGELPLSQQAKLLRALQEREVVPVGESRPRKVDVRVIAATHRDLEAMVEEGKFREDLLYRIQVVPVELPALRQRAEDVELLVRHFVAEANARRGRTITGVSKEAMRVLESYDWPGNVRQLENLIERMVLLRPSGEIDVKDLPKRILERAAVAPSAAEPTLPEDGLDLRDAVENFENQLILQALARTGWNKNRAAAVLRMNRTTLVEKMKKKNLGPEPEAGDEVPAVAGARS